MIRRGVLCNWTYPLFTVIGLIPFAEGFDRGVVMKVS